MSTPALRRYRAERLLRQQFSAMRDRVLAATRARLRGHGVHMDRSDLEDCYAQAWNGLYGAMLDGEQIEDAAAWLTTVTFRRAIDEQRTRSRRLRDGAVQLEEWAQQSAAAHDDFATEIDNRALLRQLLEGLRAELGPRERKAAALCYLHGLTRAEAAAQLGVSERRMQKLMDGTRERPGVARRMNELTGKVGSGGWCEHQSSLIRAYAMGALEPGGERHQLAAAHVRECPACRAQVRVMRGLAAVLPPLLLPAPPLAGAGAQAARVQKAPSRSGAGAHGLRAAGGTGVKATLAAKLAAVGLVAAGGGYAVLAAGAPGRPAGPAPAPRAAALARPRAQPQTQTRVAASRPRHRHHPRTGAARPAPAQTQPLAQAPAPAPSSAAPAAASPAPEEFTPERR